MPRSREPNNESGKTNKRHTPLIKTRPTGGNTDVLVVSPLYERVNSEITSTEENPAASASRDCDSTLHLRRVVLKDNTEVRTGDLETTGAILFTGN